MDSKHSAAAVSGLLVAALALTGCASRPGMHDARPAGPAYAGDGHVTTMTGHGMASSEHDYLTTMVAHHREAIVAAGQLARSDRPALRRLGVRIIHAQARQVRQMRSWLDRWYWPAPLTNDYQPMMSDLTSLEGDDLDRTFLVEMVHHHMMAVMMSRRLLSSGLVHHRPVARLATSVVHAQSEEMAQMRRWLLEWRLR